MFQVLSTYVNALQYVGATLLFLSLLVARNFYVLSNVPKKPFSLTTPVGDSVVSKRVFRSFPISFPTSISMVELIELDMVDSDVIL